MVNVNDALNIAVDDVKRPPMLPVGSYRVSVAKLPEKTASDDGKWIFIDFALKVIEAQDDVDQDELREFGGLANVQRRHRIMLNAGDDDEAKAANKRSLFNLKRFLVDHLGVATDGSATMNQLLEQSVGQQCLISIGRRPDKRDQEVIYEDIKSTAPLA